MNAHIDGGQVEIVENHRHVVVQSAHRMEVQLQLTRRRQRQIAAVVVVVDATAANVIIGGRLFAEPQLHVQREFRPFDGLAQMTAVDYDFEDSTVLLYRLLRT